MTEPRARKDLADRAAEIWKDGGRSYSEAVDQALWEQNPTGDATTGERLLYALLNVSEAKPVLKRHQALTDPRDALLRLGGGDGTAKVDPTPDGDETHRP